LTQPYCQTVIGLMIGSARFIALLGELFTGTAGCVTRLYLLHFNMLCLENTGG